MRSLLRKIMQAYESDDAIFIYVVGRVGAGKTSFALHLLKETYGTWNVLDYVFFDVREFMKIAYKHIRRQQRIKAVVLDDAGATMNALRFREKDMIKIAEVFNFARTFAAAVIFTTPDVYDVLKRIRVKAMFLVQVDVISREKSLARVYETKYSAAYDKYYRKLVSEIEFPRRYPIHDQYMKKRYDYLRKRVKEIIKRDKRSGRTYSLTKVICEKCGREGYLVLRDLSDKLLYIYVQHRENGKTKECYIGSLKEKRDSLVAMIKYS